MLSSVCETQIKSPVVWNFLWSLIMLRLTFYQLWNIPHNAYKFENKITMLLLEFNYGVFSQLVNPMFCFKKFWVTKNGVVSVCFPCTASLLSFKISFFQLRLALFEKWYIWAISNIQSILKIVPTTKRTSENIVSSCVMWQNTPRFCQPCPGVSKYYKQQGLRALSFESYRTEGHMSENHLFLCHGSLTHWSAELSEKVYIWVMDRVSKWICRRLR